ncbi:MAG: hypothetical protein HQK53_14770 [Oligoflexia bacterium]|nr:hypothetical protein [Oligoflexia bacterium]
MNIYKSNIGIIIALIIMYNVTSLFSSDDSPSRWARPRRIQSLLIDDEYDQDQDQDQDQEQDEEQERITVSPPNSPINGLDQSAAIAITKKKEYLTRINLWKRGQLSHGYNTIEYNSKDETDENDETNKNLDTLFDWSKVSRSEPIFYLQQTINAPIQGLFSLAFLSELYQQDRISLTSLIFTAKLKKWIHLFNVPKQN